MSVKLHLEAFQARISHLRHRSLQEMQIWLTYRTHTKELIVPADTVGKPNNVDWVSILQPIESPDVLY